MDFERVVVAITEALERRGLSFVVVGGVALAIHGVPRLTMDLDLAVDGERQEDVLAVLGDLGYECLHRSRGYSNHVHPEAAWGRVDILYVRGHTWSRILADARRHRAPGNIHPQVASVEHLIAMKAFALRGGAVRRSQELEDVRRLAEVAGVAAERVREIFTRYEVAHLLEEG